MWFNKEKLVITADYMVGWLACNDKKKKKNAMLGQGTLDLALGTDEHNDQS